jgi:hypothetical protein
MGKYKSYRIEVASLLVLGGLTQGVQAMPMFTTQTGMDCAGCHMQSMPKLNKIGRNFMLSGMTLSQKIVDSNSSDIDINPSMLIKLKYEKTWDKPTKSGRIQDEEDSTNEGLWSIPRTASVYFGGRVTENIGGLLRFAYRKDHDESISGKAVYAKEIDDGYIGATFYSSSNFGPFSGMEVYNTGLYKPLRSFDIRKPTNATQACEVGTGAATGLQVYYGKDQIIGDEDHLFVTAGFYAPGQDNLYMDLSSNLLPFARIAYEYPIGDYNLIFGAFAIVGGSTTSDTSTLRVKRETYGLDFQLEGEILERSISVIATNIFKNDVEYTGIGAGSTEDLQSIKNDAFSIEGQIMATEELGLKLAYLQYNDLKYYENRKYINVKDIDSSVTLGADYTFVVYVPMKLAAEYSWAKPALDRVADYQNFHLTLTLPF